MNINALTTGRRLLVYSNFGSFVAQFRHIISLKFTKSF
jgi:hypothetical protein